MFGNNLTKNLLKVTGISFFLLTTGETAQAIITPNNNPNHPDFVVQPGETDPVSGISLDGVSDLIIDRRSRCTGSRIGSNLVLTAAHCVTDSSGNLTANNIRATWKTANGNFSLNSQSIHVHPDWTGNVLDGADIAVIEMNDEINSSVPTYDLFFGATELTEIVTKVGYGRSGTGTTGATQRSGTKRQGQNVYDAFLNSGIVLYDFDNGNIFNSTFGGTGLGAQEINIAPGDSGGPGFINGLIAGVSSFGARISSPPDLDGSLNFSFGEFAGDARVSQYSDFLLSFTSTSDSSDNGQFLGTVESVNATPAPFGINQSLGVLFLGGMFAGRRFLKAHKNN